MSLTIYTPQHPEGQTYDDTWVHRWNDDHLELFQHSSGRIITFSDFGWYSFEEETQRREDGGLNFRTEGRI